MTFEHNVAPPPLLLEPKYISDRSLPPTFEAFCRKSTHISMPCYISKEAHKYGLLFHNTVVGHLAMI